MASEILQSFLRNELRGDLRTALRQAAQDKVFRRLVDEQLVSDTQALIDEAKSKLPALHERLAKLDETIAERQDELQEKRLEKAPHLMAREEGNIKAERLVVARADEAIIAIERQVSELSAALTTDKNRRNTVAIQVERLNNALAQLRSV